MLEEQDIKQIRTAIQEEVGEVKKGLEDMGETIQELATHVDEQILYIKKDLGDRLDKVEGSVGNMRSGLVDLVTKQSLRIQEQITQAVGKQVQETENRLQKTLRDTKDEVIKEIKVDRERHKLFNLKVLHIFERSKIAQPEEVVAMRELVI